MSTVMEVRIGALLTNLAAGLCAALEEAKVEAEIPKPDLCTVLPGSLVAYDYCTEGGMAYTRLVVIEPVTTTPGVCALEYDVTVEMGILRCAPVIEEDGALPTDAEELAASMLQFFDMGLMHKVMTCTPVPASMDFQQLGNYVPVGPDGQCIGGYWTCTWRTA